VNDIVLEANQPLDEAELNELYAAAWPDHTSAEFGYLTERGHTWVTAHRNGRLVGFGYVVWTARRTRSCWNPPSIRTNAAEAWADGSWPPSRTKRRHSARTGCTSTTRNGWNRSTEAAASGTRQLA
jgi:hypothetical protein